MKYSQIENSLISYCNGCKKTETYDITLNSALHEISNCKFSNEIEDLRATADSELKKIKKGKLKAYLFGGKFTKRNKNEITKYSSICILDFDHVKDEPEVAKKNIFSNEYVFAAWISPSGDGVKALVMFDYSNIIINSENEYINYHAEAYNQFYQTIFFPYNLDTSGKDISRLCFTSSDPGLLIKNDFKQYVVTPIVVIPASNVNTPQKHSSNVSKIIPESEVKDINHPTNNKNRHSFNSIYKYLRKRKLSITSTYQEWFIIAQAIANTFSYSIGKNYFLKLCELDFAKNDVIKSSLLIKQCYKNSVNYNKERVTFKTVIYAAHLKGWNQ